MNLSAHTNYANPFFTRQLQGLTHSLTANGTSSWDASKRAIAQLSAQADLQASVLGFKNAFCLMAIVVLVLTPLPFLMRRPSAAEAAASAAAH